MNNFRRGFLWTIGKAIADLLLIVGTVTAITVLLLIAGPCTN